MKHLFVRIGQKTKTISKRGGSLAMAAGLLAAVVLGSMPLGNANAASVQNLKPTPRVSFTFDDGLVSSLQKAAPALAAHGLSGTNYVITKCVGMTTAPNTCAADPNKTYMTWAQIKQLHDQYGWEIGSHTETHPQLSTDKLTQQQLTSELSGSQATLKAQGYDAQSIAFPYGDYDTNVLAQTAKYYESARGFADTDSMNTWPYNANLLYDQQVQAGAPAPTWSLCTDMTVAGVKACIDKAVTNNQWLILTFHNIADTPDKSAGSYDYATADLDAIAAYAKSKQDAGTLKVVNVSDGVTRGTNLLTNGNFASGITNGWTTDNATNITADAGNNGRYPEPTHAISLKATTAVTADGHLFSPKVTVAFGKTYLLKNYLNMLSGGSVTFAVDEYDASGTWISWVDPQAGRAYDATANAVNTGETAFTYTPTSASVATAALQVIVRGGQNTQAYLDASQWFDTAEIADTTAPVVSVAVDPNGTPPYISWGTNEAFVSAKVEVGPTTSYGTELAYGLLGNDYISPMDGFAPGTYYYRVSATDAAGNTGTKTGSFTIPTPANPTAPTISNVNVLIQGTLAARISWNTNVVATAQIDYGTTQSYGTMLQNTLTGTSPFFNLTNLSANTTYYYLLTAVATNGQSSTYTGSFTVPAVGSVPGDANGDGSVGIKDATIVSLHWGMQNATRADGDVNGDGTVGIKDATLISLNWSQK